MFVSVCVVGISIELFQICGAFYNIDVIANFNNKFM